MKQLERRVAVVTGAGGGIGRATSLALAKAGCRLALADIDLAGLEQTQRQAAALGAEAKTYQVDVSDRTRMESFPDQIASDFGGVHILINNAGVSVRGCFTDQSLEDFEWLMGINFWGVVYGCKYFLSHLLAASEAHIVNVSSVFGLVSMPQQSSYCASKFAVRGFSEALRNELAETGIGVTCVHPGPIATNIAVSTRVRGNDAVLASHKDTIERFKTQRPPERAASAILAGIKRNKARVLISPQAHLLDMVQRIAPSIPALMLSQRLKRLQGST